MPVAIEQRLRAAIDVAAIAHVDERAGAIVTIEAIPGCAIGARVPHDARDEPVEVTVIIVVAECDAHAVLIR